ncbi:macro domain-containing protein [Nocardia asteroides]|uniref:macro domain-containing protein n=1 Tax=Nocardia asteroides TaxID=1824 RepID=UPI003F4CC64A
MVDTGVREVCGDLLRAEVDALVNPVNTVGVMGKGLALAFRRAYPEMFREYAAACQRGEVVVGSMFVWRDGPRFVVNFPTKRHWRSRSTVADIEAGLSGLVSTVRELGIRSIAVPALGCGYGGLEWPAVEPLIRSAFEPLSATVGVYLYPPTVARGSADGE